MPLRPRLSPGDPGCPPAADRSTARAAIRLATAAAAPPPGSSPSSRTGQRDHRRQCQLLLTPVQRQQRKQGCAITTATQHGRSPQTTSALSCRRAPGATLSLLCAAALLPHAPLLPAAAAAAAGASGPGERATVQEILDGPDLWIERRRARVRDQATAPELMRSGDSRAQLAFRSGAAGRMNRFSQLRLGSRCFLLEQGQMLLSGPQSLCTRSARLSVRGTHVLVELDASGAASVSVLEGQVELEPLREGWAAGGAPASPPTATPTVVNQGQRLRLGSDGRVLALERLTAADYRAFVEGPLVDGFTTPLPQQPALERSLGAVAPGLSLACAAGAETGLTTAINGLRQQQGRPAFTALPPELAERNCRYLAPVLRRILSSGDCDHDRPRWQALQNETSQGSALSPVSELIACPGGGPTLEPQQILQRWLGSPLHTDLLLHRQRASHLDCVGLTASGQRVAMCTTWGGGTEAGRSGSAAGAGSWRGASSSGGSGAGH